MFNSWSFHTPKGLATFMAM